MTTQPITDKELLYVPMLESHSFIKLYQDKEFDSCGQLWHGVRGPDKVIPLLPADYHLIGVMPGMSEKECAGCVERVELNHSKNIYKNYITKDDGMLRVATGFDTATESLLSRMEAAGALMKNPYGLTCPEEDEDNDGNMTGYIDAVRAQRWRMAEAKRADMWAVLRIVK